MATPESKGQTLMFDADTLRKTVGVVAILLPLMVKWRASTPLTSISASYYTEAHDIFVGALFIIGALFLAYHGHSGLEIWISRLGAVAAFTAALCPTACDTCQSNIWSTIHYGSAAVLFGATAYFCLFPFRVAALNKKLKGEKAADEAKDDAVKKSASERKAKEAKERILIYWGCGLIILICIFIAFVSNFVVPDETRQSLRLTYTIEWVALWAFGFAWLVAGKIITWVRGKLTIRL